VFLFDVRHPKTHGKVDVCRAPDEKRTANILAHGNLPFSRSELDSKSSRKTKHVRIPCGCPHARCVLLFNKAGVEDPKEILDKLHVRKSALENIVSCDRIFKI
jgi:hypothetical protein